MDIFDSYLARIGGTNPYGQPMFRLVWGGTATRVAYGQTDTGRKGQHEYLRYHGIPAYFLEFWNPPEKYGTPEAWYRNSWDAVSGMHIAGDYPFLGDYERVAQFYSKERINGKMEIVPIQVTFQALDDLVALVFKAREISIVERQRQLQAEVEAEKANSARIAHDAYTNATPAWGGAASSKESNREAQVSKINLTLTADQIKPANRHDEWKWAMQNRHLSQEEIDSQVLN
jgi:hypothetical protein